jgi:hypothetical protein
MYTYVKRINAGKSMLDAQYAKCQLNLSISGAKGAIMVAISTTY